MNASLMLVGTLLMSLALIAGGMLSHEGIFLHDSDSTAAFISAVTTSCLGGPIWGASKCIQ